MGGYGSGQWHRWGSKRTTDEVGAVDVRAWHRAGWLDPTGLKIPLTLIRFDGEFRTMRVDVAEDRSEVILSYKTSKAILGGTWRWSVPIEWTPCNYGGSRPWFVCPDCGERVAKLYISRFPFVCRRCVGLVYETQRESNLEHVTRKYREARVRLGGSPVFTERMSCERPKGMHLRTYYRLLQEVVEASQEYREAMEAWGAGTRSHLERIIGGLQDRLEGPRSDRLG